MKIYLGTYEYDEKEGYSISHSAYGSTNSWDKIIKATNQLGIKFNLVLVPQSRQKKKKD